MRQGGPSDYGPAVPSRYPGTSNLLVLVKFCSLAQATLLVATHLGLGQDGNASSGKADGGLVSLSLRLKDLLGPVTRVKKKKTSGGGRPAGRQRRRMRVEPRCTPTTCARFDHQYWTIKPTHTTCNHHDDKVDAGRASLHPHHLIGTVLNLRTTTSQKCEAVPRRARI